MKYFFSALLLLGLCFMNSAMEVLPAKKDDNTLNKAIMNKRCNVLTQPLFMCAIMDVGIGTLETYLKAKLALARYNVRALKSPCLRHCCSDCQAVNQRPQKIAAAQKLIQSFEEELDIRTQLPETQLQYYPYLAYALAKMPVIDVNPDGSFANLMVSEAENDYAMTEKVVNEFSGYIRSLRKN